MSDPTTKPTGRSVTQFLNRIADATKRRDCFTILKLMQQATRAKPKMWGSSIVGFGAYPYKYASGREGEWPLVGFSPRKQNITLYIMPGFERYSALLKKLGKFKTGKACLYINRMEDIDPGALRELVKRSVEHMREKSVK